MKKLIILFLSAVTIFSFTKCSNSSADKLCENADTRGKIISELMSNDAYMKEVMDAMKTKHADAIVSTSCDMMKDDKTTGTKMMSSMMDMCMTDTDMCKMMMGKTMDICDMDKSKCKMMMESMESHPKGMKEMKDMGMCDMKGMNMEERKEEHAQHHMK